ncbi:hypothetical protein GCM10023093_05950 [Nemorincola caseinilytica]|uniref:Uncharacterized protein n=1 Tax=Nemorincola caseinilytica TaxID=2054315 RepID=A0ABP8N972_9BACT
MNLISSDIVTTEYDVFWQDISSFVKEDMGPAPVLVITGPLASGSTDEVQLRKMLDACKLQPGQYNIVGIAEGAKAAWHQFRHRLSPRVVLLLGIDPGRLGISALFRLCEPNRFDGAIWLPAPAIAAMEREPEVKKQLWLSAMKPVLVDKIFGDLTSAETML